MGSGVNSQMCAPYLCDQRHAPDPGIFMAGTTHAAAVLVDLEHPGIDVIHRDIGCPVGWYAGHLGIARVACTPAIGLPLATSMG